MPETSIMEKLIDRCFSFATDVIDNETLAIVILGAIAIIALNKEMFDIVIACVAAIGPVLGIKVGRTLQPKK